jgi:hypothetical protein
MRQIIRGASTVFARPDFNNIMTKISILYTKVFLAPSKFPYISPYLRGLNGGRGIAMIALND